MEHSILIARTDGSKVISEILFGFSERMIERKNVYFKLRNAVRGFFFYFVIQLPIRFYQASPDFRTTLSN